MAYVKQTWVKREKVSSVKLNHMEDGIAAISANGAIDTANLANAAVTAEKLDKSATDIVADTFSTSAAYSAGDYVIYSGALYRFTAGKTAGAWDSTKVVAVALADDVDELKSAFTHVIEKIPQTETLDENSQIWTIADNTYCDSSGLASSNSHKSFYTTVNTKTILFFTDYVYTYTSLCIFTSGVMGGDGYTRYRIVNGTGEIPQEGSPLVISEGSLICVSINKNSGSHFALKVTSDGQYYKTSEYLLLPKAYRLAYDGTNLSVRGENGVECVFNRNDFNENPGLFELQNLTYKGDVIFGTVNDYIGPVRINGESIKGAKHGGETTDRVTIITDHGIMQSGDAIDTESFSIYVLSHISDEFSRVSLWTFNRDSMICDSIITVLKPLNIDYVFGAGIISCQDDVNVAWLNKTPLTTDVLAGLNEHTEIITNHGTLISERLSYNSNYDHRVSFVVYTGRKKLYYYTVYGNNIAVNENTVFASSAKLTFS